MSRSHFWSFGSTAGRSYSSRPKAGLPRRLCFCRRPRKRSSARHLRMSTVREFCSPSTASQVPMRVLGGERRGWNWSRSGLVLREVTAYRRYSRCTAHWDLRHPLKRGRSASGPGRRSSSPWTGPGAAVGLHLSESVGYPSSPGSARRSHCRQTLRTAVTEGRGQEGEVRDKSKSVGNGN